MKLELTPKNTQEQIQEQEAVTNLGQLTKKLGIILLDNAILLDENNQITLSPALQEQGWQAGPVFNPKSEFPTIKKEYDDLATTHANAQIKIGYINNVPDDKDLDRCFVYRDSLKYEAQSVTEFKKHDRDKLGTLQFAGELLKEYSQIIDNDDPEEKIEANLVSLFQKNTIMYLPVIGEKGVYYYLDDPEITDDILYGKKQVLIKDQQTIDNTPEEVKIV